MILVKFVTTHNVPLALVQLILVKLVVKVTVKLVLKTIYVILVMLENF